MKKPIALAVSFGALLTLSIFAPKIFWQDSYNVSRFPASEEAIMPLEKENKEEEKSTTEVSCLKETQPIALEEEIKKLMADKETILKEIEDLKTNKKESQKVASVSNDKDIVALISQMTSIMISQQEQQQTLMLQMFTMMNQMQMPMQSYPQQESWSQDFMYPMSFESSTFGNSIPGISIGLPYQSLTSYQNPYELQKRSPSGLTDPSFSSRSFNIQPQFQSEYPNGNMGFNFLSSDASSEMQRMTF